MWILSPLSWLLIGLLVLAYAWKSRQRRPWLAVMCASIGIIAVLAMTPLFANTMLATLEEPPASPLFCESSLPMDAVLLAGGTDQLPDDDRDVAVLNIASRRRAEAAADWWKQKPGRRLAVAGGPPIPGVTAESTLLKLYLQRLGVDASAIGLETVSRDTWENAHNLARLSPALPKRVVLITSAVHMRRARYAMNRAGFEVCPLAADFRQEPFSLPGYLIPQGGAMEKTQASLHEIVGMLYYRMR